MRRLYDEFARALKSPDVSGALQKMELAAPVVTPEQFAAMIASDIERVSKVIKEVGRTGIPIVNVENACSSSASALRLAFQQVATGIYDVVLVLGMALYLRFSSDPKEFPWWPLVAGALIVALVIGVPLGILGGAYPRHWASRLSATLSLALVSCPPMVAALALLWIAATTQWMSMEPGAWVLPTLALGVPLAASIERLQSQAVREAMGGLEVVAAAVATDRRARPVLAAASNPATGPCLAPRR